MPLRWPRRLLINIYRDMHMKTGILNSIGKLKAYQHNGLLQYKDRIFHGSFARTGGISPPPFDSLNTNASSGDVNSNVQENRKRVCEAIGANLRDVVIIDVCHGDQVAIVSEAGEINSDDLRNADALITKRPGACLFLSTADCNPLFMFDPVSKQIGLAHIGWRGVAANLAEKFVKAMCENGCNDPSQLVAALGPSIGPCCYRMRNPAQLTMPGWSQYLSTGSDGLTAIDLWSPVRDQLVSAGLKIESIELPNICTACNTQHFFSFWAEKPATGRFPSVIRLA